MTTKELIKSYTNYLKNLKNKALNIDPSDKEFEAMKMRIYEVTNFLEALKNLED